MQRLLKTPDMSINLEYVAYTNLTKYIQFLDDISSHMPKYLFVDVQTSFVFLVLVD